MQAVRPPKGTVTALNYSDHIVADSVGIMRKPESVLTRVFVYYGQRSYLSTDIANFNVVNGQIEEENELPQSGGEARTLEIKARWVGTEAHAQQIISRILSRYRDVPRFLTIYVSAKDRTLTVGDVCDVTAREIVDTEGRVKTDRWQIISWAEIKPGQVYALDLQTYELVGRFGNWMADISNEYSSATADELANGAFWADDAGLMPDGSKGYQWQ